VTTRSKYFIDSSLPMYFERWMVRETYC